jgi:RNA polymerase sigma-70 factor (ECF subfamily)
VVLLRLRFHDGLAIRDIAERLGEDAAKLHHEYATAREEFRTALRSVVAFHHPAAPTGELDHLAAELLALLG